ncbi:MAG: hypothetical protein MK098_08805, partial [Marinovum sp.]|nr:hypothetical protein [Marinovum sp.]
MKACAVVQWANSPIGKRRYIKTGCSIATQAPGGTSNATRRSLHADLMTHTSLAPTKLYSDTLCPCCPDDKSRVP